MQKTINNINQFHGIHTDDQDRKDRQYAKNQGVYGKKLEIQVTNTKTQTMWIIGRSEDQMQTTLWNGSGKTRISTTLLNKKIR